MERILLFVVIGVAAVLGFFLLQGEKSGMRQEGALLALVDYRDVSGSETAADGVAVVDFNPNSSTFGQILQKVDLGKGALPHHLHANRDGSKLYTSALGEDSLFRISMKNSRIDAIVPLDATGCVIGEDLYFSEDGSTFYLSCMGSDRIMVFDAETDQVIDEIRQEAAPDKPFIRYPHGMGVDEAIDRMIVTETISGDLKTPGTTVSVVEFSSGQVLSTQELLNTEGSPMSPVEVLFLPNRPIAYITGMLDTTMWAAIWDEAQQTFEFNVVDDGSSRNQSWPLEMNLGPDGNLYVSFAQPGGVNVYSLEDPDRPRLIKTYVTGAGAHHVEFSPAGDYMFVQNNMLNLEGMNAGTISVVALKSGKTVATIDAFNEAGLKPESIMLLD